MDHDQRFQTAPLTEQRRFLLGECVQAYLPLDEEQRLEFERLVATEPYRGVQAMNATWYEKGIEQGIEKERRESLCELLAERFGPLSAAVLERLQRLPVERLPALRKAFLRAQALRDLGLED